jgi:hypothetical protein
LALSLTLTLGRILSLSLTLTLPRERALGLAFTGSMLFALAYLWAATAFFAVIFGCAGEEDTQNADDDKPQKELVVHYSLNYGSDNIDDHLCFGAAGLLSNRLREQKATGK